MGNTPVSDLFCINCINCIVLIGVHPSEWKCGIAKTFDYVTGTWEHSACASERMGSGMKCGPSGLHYREKR